MYEAGCNRILKLLEKLLGTQQQIETKSLEFGEQEFGCGCPYRNYGGRCCMRGFKKIQLQEKYTKAEARLGQHEMEMSARTEAPGPTTGVSKWGEATPEDSEVGRVTMGMNG